MCRPMRTCTRPELSLSTIARDASSAPGRGGKREEERVALRVDLRAALLRTRLAHDSSVLGERRRVFLGAELVEKLGRAFDIGEEEGDGACGEIGSHDEIMRGMCARLKSSDGSDQKESDDAASEARSRIGSAAKNEPTVTTTAAATATPSAISRGGDPPAGASRSSAPERMYSQRTMFR